MAVTDRGAWNGTSPRASQVAATGFGSVPLPASTTPDAAPRNLTAASLPLAGGRRRQIPFESDSESIHGWFLADVAVDR